MTNSLQEAILVTISHIPQGKICTYGQIAKLAGTPGYARYVGHLLKNLPNNSNIPWHRVINAQGKSSFPENSPKWREQLNLLQREGIDISNHRISIPRHLWSGE